VEALQQAPELPGPYDSVDRSKASASHGHVDIAGSPLEPAVAGQRHELDTGPLECCDNFSNEALFWAISIRGRLGVADRL
jgi:hypothetical protein